MNDKRGEVMNNEELKKALDESDERLRKIQISYTIVFAVLAINWVVVIVLDLLGGCND